MAEGAPCTVQVSDTPMGTATDTDVTPDHALGKIRMGTSSPSPMATEVAGLLGLVTSKGLVAALAPIIARTLNFLTGRAMGMATGMVAHPVGAGPAVLAMDSSQGPDQNLSEYQRGYNAAYNEIYAAIDSDDHPNGMPGL